MVAGQAITTQAVTKDFEEGFERTFGERKLERGRFRYNPETGQCEPLGSDWTDTERKAKTVTEEVVYGKLQATDGTDLSSRRKHRDYMKANNLSLATDFKEHWKKAERERERVLSGEADTKERKEIIGRTLHELRSKRR
jgi:hypothetical protein